MMFKTIARYLYHKEVDCHIQYVHYRERLSIRKITVIASDYEYYEAVNLGIGGDKKFCTLHLSSGEHYPPAIIFTFDKTPIVVSELCYWKFSFPSEREYTVIVDGLVEKVIEEYSIERNRS